VRTPASLALIGVLESDEYRVLQGKFSSGINVHELQSVAILIAHLTGIAAPSRAEKRNGAALVRWYMQHWAHVIPLLPMIELRDQGGEVISARRELSEKGVTVEPSARAA
jgi:hypothetical protein